MSFQRFASVSSVAGGEPISTGEVAARLRVSVSGASHMLRSMERAGLVHRIRHGLWWVGTETPDRFSLAAALTSPSPSYVSFASALSFHGVIDQLPREVTVASTGRPRVIHTDLGDVRVHRLPPDLFGGWQVMDRAWIATPEKAIFDVAYVAAARATAANIPELDLPPSFDMKIVEGWVGRVRSRRLRTRVSERLESVLRKATR